MGHIPNSKTLDVKITTGSSASNSSRLTCIRVLYVALALYALLLAGCTSYQSLEDHVDLGVTKQTTIYRNQWVNRAPPEVYIHPQGQATYIPKVLFVPLRVTQQMEHPGMVSHSISRAIYSVWNAMQLFPAMEYSSDDTPYRRDRALALGKKRKADMVVGGFITYYYPGGSIGDSQIAIQLEAHDLASGQLVWSMAQSGMVPAAQKKDYILFATQTRLPTDPTYAIARTIAIDMGKKIQNWLTPAPSKTKWQGYDDAINEAVFQERDPIPSPRQPEQAPAAPDMF